MENSADSRLPREGSDAVENPTPADVHAGRNKVATTVLAERPAEPKISKGAAKKEAKKAANKAIKQESKKEHASKTVSKTTPLPSHQTTSAQAEDPDSMFKVGFLADVYKERPVGSDGVTGVVTRCA